MRIALAQTYIIWEDKERNINYAEKIVRSSDAELVLFPEMSFTGFSMDTDVTGEADRWTVDRMSSIAKNYHKAVGFGWVRKRDALAENVYTVVGADGEVLLSISDQEGTLIFDLQPDVGQYRNAFPVLKDRREDIYKEINRKL